MRCKNCNMSIPNDRESGFCSKRCEKEFKINFNPNKHFDGRGSFALIAAVIGDMFYKLWTDEPKEINNNKRWIKDVVCQAWCDCSENFENDKLLKNYENSYRETRSRKSIDI